MIAFAIFAASTGSVRVTLICMFTVFKVAEADTSSASCEAVSSRCRSGSFTTASSTLGDVMASVNDLMMFCA
ncbi:MAG: hypothetical protein BGO95_06975 [Micrococcales bacterium 73-13]|nr:MAG: hypothetical protein BGO95_06975 [Micrococcales bacterium 73-13]